MLTSNSIRFGTINSYRTLHEQAYLIVWVKGPEMRCPGPYISTTRWFPGQLYIDAFSTIFPGQLHIDAFSTTVVSQSTLNQWLFNTLAMSPGNPNSNAYSIIKITIDQCCSNVYAINIDNIRFHRYCNDDSTFILRWNFNINHNDDSDEKSIFIQCLLAVWESEIKRERRSLRLLCERLWASVRLGLILGC